MQLSYRLVSLVLRSPFALSHGSSITRDTVLVALDDTTGRGYGEIPIVPYYGIDARTVLGELQEIATVLRGQHATIAIALRIERNGAWHPFVRAGVSEALVDRIASIMGRTRAALLDQEPITDLRSAWTIAERDHRRALQLLHSVDARTIKVKTGFPGDVELVRALVTADPSRVYWIDCNGGWEPAEAIEKARQMQTMGVALIEEPVAHDFAALQRVAEAVTIPVIADESVQTADDLRVLLCDAPAARGIVVKIVKHGGPFATRAIVRTVREAGKGYLLGEMVESSVGTAHALDFAALARWIDLDAPLLITNDPGTGLDIRPGYVARSGARAASVAAPVGFTPIDP